MKRNNLIYVRSFIYIIVMVSGINLFSQQDAQYTQYMYNTASVNPGYVGSRGNLSMAALHRSQWVGIEGAPVTQTFNAHSPIGYNGVGMGLSFVNDKIGPTSEMNIDIDFSYTVYTSDEGRLSFGLKGSANILDVRFSELNQNPEYTGGDPILANDIDNRFSPNIGAGVYYHTENYYLGLSVPRILETTYFDDSALSAAQERMSFYLITGYVWDLNSNLKFKPSLLAKMINGAPLQLDFSANFMLNEKFIVGGAYRWDAAFSGMFGFLIDHHFLVGLAYDKETTELGNATFNNGSFEVVLRYDFVKSKRQIKSPRFF